ncbi:MAG: PorT family protein [Bacteroidaceae bacterium]|nr:PorT family protein [Bacteroidaceae bacterium]
MKRISLFVILLSLFSAPALRASDISTEIADTIDSTPLAPLSTCVSQYNAPRAKGWLFTAGAGFQIGGTAPTPMPRSIRKIESWNPLLCLSLEAQARRFFDSEARWSVSAGLRLEQKGMKTDASVKGYHMEMTADDGGYMEGEWTGRVKTHVRASYLTLPLLVHYRLSTRWSVHAGPYVSLLLDGDFDGEAYDGYLRHHDPTGEKAYVTHATYDFGDDLRTFAWGLQAGASCMITSRLEGTVALTVGMNGIFPKDYSSVTFALYPVYARIGLNYVF